MKHTTPLALFTLAAAPILALTAPAHAASVTLDSQDRSVSVSIRAASDDRSLDIDETVTAPDASPFDATLDRTLDLTGPPLNQDQVSTAFASQTSSQGTVAGQYLVNAQGASTYQSVGTDTLTFADSDLEVVFTLDEVAPFTVSGTGRYTSGGGGAGGYFVSLSDAFVNVFQFSRNADDFTGPGDGSILDVPFADAGTLAAGTYTLRARSGVSGGIGGITAGYDVNFSVGNIIPTPAALPAGLVLLGGLMLRRRT